MDLDIEVAGEIVEQQELLNGTRTVTLAGASADGRWTLDGVVSWNRGLVDYAGEGDLTLARDDGSELYATLVRAQASADPGDSDAEVSLSVAYQIDGGTAEFEETSGVIVGVVRLVAGAFEGQWATRKGLRDSSRES